MSYFEEKVLKGLEDDNSVIKGESARIELKEKVDEVCRLVANGKIEDIDIMLFSEGSPLKEAIKESRVFLEACKKRIADYLSFGATGKASEMVTFLERLNYGKEFINSPEILEGAKEGISCYLQGGIFSDSIVKKIQAIINFFESNNVPGEKIRETLKRGFSEAIRDNIVDDDFTEEEVIQFTEKIDLIKDDANEIIRMGHQDALAKLLEYGDKKGAIKFCSTLSRKEINLVRLSELMERFRNDTIRTEEDLIKSIDNAFFAHALENDSIKLITSSALGEYDTPLIRKHCLYALQKNFEENGEVELNDEVIVSSLEAFDKRWNIAVLKRGTEAFGLEAVLSFIDREEKDIQKALSGFSYVLDLCDAIGSDSESRRMFYNNIIQQVIKDKSDYGSGSSYTFLGYISSSLRSEDFDKLLCEARGLKNQLPEISELVDSFSDKTSIVASWASLKSFMKLKEFVGKKVYIEALGQIKDNHELYDFVKALLFKKDNKVELDVVMDLLKNPTAFLSRTDPFIVKGFEGLRPSNYSKYGIGEIKLRQALVNGSYDLIQRIVPYGIEFEVRTKTLQDAVKEALGERRKNIKGCAKNPVALYDKITMLLEKSYEVEADLEKANERNELLRKLINESLPISEELQEKIWDEIDNNEYGMEIKKHRLKVTIHRKSDPKGAESGNLVSCCASLGTGKMNEYLFNPADAVMTIALMMDDGTYKPIVQSILTSDIDTGISDHNVSNIVRTISPDKFSKPQVLTCDNIEIAPNYFNDEYIPLVASATKEFFRLYLAKYADSSNFEKDFFIVGTGYSPTFQDFELINNTFMPSSLNGYSDNKGTVCYRVSFNKPNKMLFKVIGEEGELQEHYVTHNSPISDIEATDALAISALGLRDYHGEDIIERVIEKQNKINANYILSAYDGKKSMMFKMLGSDGSPVAYLIAYESQEVEKELLVSEYVDTTHSELTADKMIAELLRRYKSRYDTELPAISFELGEGDITTLTDRLGKIDSLFQELGYEIDIIQKDHRSCRLKVIQI